tara:strand:- start:146 stop:808 length:663 start_codon:yes stop_codon:yes gene_type:complete
MPNIFTPQQDEQFITPFSPIIGYKKLSPSFVEKLNNSMNDKLEDWSDNLVGKVKQELKFDDDIINFFIEEMKDFIMKYQLNTEVYTSMGRAGLDPNSNYGISTTSGWFIRQFEGEYNPVHVHPDSMVSCVGYLKLPEGIEDEWEEDYKDHHPSHGHIQFFHGSSLPYSSTNFMFKPQVGDFIIFPAHMFHTVYPFKTKGERRSFSVNLTVHRTPKEEVKE